MTKIADESKKGTEQERTNPRSEKQTEMSEEYKRGIHKKKNGKECAAGKENLALHLYYTTGLAGLPDIGWPSSPIGTVRCTAFVLSHRTGKTSEHQLAIVACRDGWPYCMCTRPSDGRAVRTSAGHRCL